MHLNINPQIHIHLKLLQSDPIPKVVDSLQIFLHQRVKLQKIRLNQPFTIVGGPEPTWPIVSLGIEIVENQVLLPVLLLLVINIHHQNNSPAVTSKNYHE